VAAAPLKNCFQARPSVSSAARMPQVWVVWLPTAFLMVLVTPQLTLSAL
jgi:hypothetical protein